MNYHLNKVIGDNETGFDGNSDSTYRREGWEFILAGGGLYNNLDYSFTAGHELGTFKYPSTQPGGGSARLRKQLGHLQQFISSFDFVKMRPDSTIASINRSDMKPYVLTEPGNQYAVYLFRGNQTELEIDLPAGRYVLEWFDPLTGKYGAAQQLRHKGGKTKLISPAFKEDAALRIKKKR